MTIWITSSLCESAVTFVTPTFKRPLKFTFTVIASLDCIFIVVLDARNRTPNVRDVLIHQLWATCTNRATEHQQETTRHLRVCKRAVGTS